MDRDLHLQLDLDLHFIEQVLDQIMEMKIGAPAEVVGEGSSKRPRGRPANVIHFHDKEGPEHFIRIIFHLTLGLLPIPRKFFYCFDDIPGKIKVITNTGCKWLMNTRYADGGRAIINHGWAAFAIAHVLRIGYFRTFKREGPGVYKVVIFDHNNCEVMTAFRKLMMKSEAVVYLVSELSVGK